MRPVRVLISVGAIVTAAACGQGRPPQSARGAEVSQARPAEQLAVQQDFRPSAVDRRMIDSLLELARERIVDGAVLTGELREFGRDRGRARYLLLTQVRPSRDSLGRIRLVVLGGADGVSEAQPWELAAGLDNFMIALIQDLDGDSLPDIAYCYRAPGSSGNYAMRAAGYRGGRWYHLTSVSSALAKCPLPDVSP